MDYSKMSREELISVNQELHAHLTRLQGEYSDQQKTEKSLKAAEAQFKALAETIPAIIFVYSLTNEKMPIRYINKSFEEVSGYCKDEIINSSWVDFIHPDDRHFAVDRANSRSGDCNITDRFELRLISRDKKEFYVEITVKQIEWNGENSVIGIIYDISNRKDMEIQLRQAHDELENRVLERTSELLVLNQKLKRSEANFRALAETSPAMIYVNKGDSFLYTNTTCSLITGYSREELSTMNAWDFLRPDYRELVRRNNLERQKGVQIPPYEVVIQDRCGKEIWGYIYADMIDYEGVIATLVMIVDITERKRMEEDLLQASKLESVGILAGGIAHDFNNILTVISGNASLAKMLLNPGDDIAELLAEIEMAVRQARDLTQQLLTFSKGGAPIKETASIKDLLRESASFVLRGSNVNCFYVIPDDLWPVSIDRGQMNQVINNLVINADQAMPEGGVIILYAENHAASPENNLMTGNYIKIGIIDAGVGIAPQNLPKIFDPYFSTKTKGHGLGLASCYSIIKKHDGHIKVSSNIGIGTAVSIYLPAYPEQFVKSKDSPAVQLTGWGRVLIMDDETVVRETLSKMLKSLGYTTATAADGYQAIQMYKQSKQKNERFDAVIMDLTVAGAMGGKEAVKKLLSYDPGAKVIVSSGYSTDPVMADYKKYGFCGVLPKPYQIKEVSLILHEVLQFDHQVSYEISS